MTWDNGLSTWKTQGQSQCARMRTSHGTVPGFPIRIVVGVLVFAFWFAAAQAQVPIRDWVGEEVPGHDARALARCGAVGTDVTAGAVFGNPATLGFLARRAVQVGYRLRISTEQRTQVVYDQFENALGELAYADNIHSIGAPGAFAAAATLGKAVGAVGLTQVRSFDYRYVKAYRDDFYVKVGEDRVVQTGALYSVAAAAAYRVFDRFGLGLRGGYLFGSRRLESWRVRGVDTSFLRDDGRPTGFLFGAGLALVPRERFTVVTDFQSGYRLSNWRSADWNQIPRPPSYEGSYPWVAKLAVSYRVTGPLPGTVAAEAGYSVWRGLDSSLSNVLAVRAGVEHRMLSLVRLRYGFGVEPRPDDPAIQVAGFGLGSGFDAGLFRVDLGVYLSRNVIGPTRFWPELTETDTRILESRNYLAVTLSREF